MVNLFFEGLFNSIYFIVGIFILGLILNLIEDKNIYYLQQGTGKKGLLITGIIGVPVHELSHYITCRIFLHKVESVELFRPSALKNDGVLGRVVHSREKGNIYKMIGDFFIGTAPVIIGSIIIYSLIRLYLGSEAEIFDMIVNIDKSINMIESREIVKFILHILTAGIDTMFLILKSPSLKSIQGILILFSVYSISIHLSLSKKDIENSINASFIVALIIIILTVVLGYFGFNFGEIFTKSVTYLFMIMTMCIVICIPFTAVSIIISYIGSAIRRIF
ncbi:hypothetical protein EXD82_04980 [Peptacetobacter hominis]|uniref:DUF3267 domain-containing protein n=1 Tax=Peptacetobacter hominis TaxID=2743610 RepID=A0A544QVN7_9FIRM|nr:hypothetical protein [Peptacetobacter hominis]TQQ84759.1 hypothetical protein EXD82_04980 [Peptacetobacter hominis]